MTLDTDWAVQQASQVADSVEVLDSFPLTQKRKHTETGGNDSTVTKFDRIFTKLDELDKKITFISDLQKGI